MCGMPAGWVRGRGDSIAGDEVTAPPQTDCMTLPQWSAVVVAVAQTLVRLHRYDTSQISRLLNLPAERVWTAETSEVGRRCGLHSHQGWRERNARCDISEGRGRQESHRYLH